MEEFIGYIAVALILLVGLAVLGAIVRCSVVSPRRLEGAGSLRQPDLSGVESACGFQLPDELGTFFRLAAFVERTEFELIDDSVSPPRVWEIGAFIPLTPTAVREWQKISGLREVPIASDNDKGIYFVDRTGVVKYWSPEFSAPSIVTRSVEALQNFSPVEEFGP